MEQYKTEYQARKDARDLKLYQEYQLMMSHPGAMDAAVSAILMKKYGIHAKSTIWQIRKKVEKRLNKNLKTA